MIKKIVLFGGVLSGLVMLPGEGSSSRLVVDDGSGSGCLIGKCSLNFIEDSASSDTIIPSIYGPELLYGVDTSSSPCEDFYRFSNGEWRDKAVFPVRKGSPKSMVNYLSHVKRVFTNQVVSLVDSAGKVHSQTERQTLRVLGELYESCMVDEKLDKVLTGKSDKTASTAKKSTRKQWCVQRVLDNLSEAAGQYYAEDMQKTNAITKMEEVLFALKSEVLAMLSQNTLMNDDEKQYAMEKINKLVLRVGIPEKLVDYSQLKLSTTDYHANKQKIANFFINLSTQAIGEDTRQKWKMSLLNANAGYMASENAIEVPTLMFTPPFFYPDGEDAKNFAGVGYVIGHEIFHGVASGIYTIENPKMQEEIEAFKDFSTSMGSLDGWTANGQRTFTEDIADLGGGRAAYRAWKSVVGKKGVKHQLIDGYNDEQRFFIALGKIWRSKWVGGVPNSGVHGPPFARTNLTVIQIPEFSQVFGCKEGDKMYVSPDKLSIIW